MKFEFIKKKNNFIPSRYIERRKTLDEMTDEEEQSFIDEINYYFVDFIEAAPYVEIGDTSGGQTIKLREQVHEGRYSVGSIIFELQMKLNTYQKRHPELGDMKLIVQELEYTPDIRSEYFHPIRGIMVKMKYEKREN